MINFDYHQFAKGGKAEKLENLLRPQLKLHWEDFGIFAKGENVSPRWVYPASVSKHCQASPLLASPGSSSCLDREHKWPSWNIIFRWSVILVLNRSFSWTASALFRIWKIARTCIRWHCVADVVKICNGIQCACTVKLWVGIIGLNTWWSCSINSWLDVIFKNIPFFFFPSLLFCLVTEVCRQGLFEWIVWTAWIVLTVYSPSLHWRWVRHRTFHDAHAV